MEMSVRLQTNIAHIMTVPKHYYICLCLQHAVNTCGYQRGEMNSDQTAGKLNSTIPFSRTEMKLKRRRSSGVGKNRVGVKIETAVQITRLSDWLETATRLLRHPKT